MPAASPVWPAPPAWLASPAPAAPDDIVADAIQLAIAFLTAGLDSPELEAWAADTLPPPGAEGLADLMAGLNVISVLLLHELHEATEEPPPAILQRLALLAENRRRRYLTHQLLSHGQPASPCESPLRIGQYRLPARSSAAGAST